ncbi:MAG: 30S ribosomal protein S20 [Oscillospiraceae bacterium]|jgi:small subunit ribosomal protein S20|nr:30S ribosomal protein S20 [Oscillospiraceae bacterium]
MPNIKSASKRVLISRALNLKNRAARSVLKTQIKKFETAVAAGDRAGAEVAYKSAVKVVDKSAAHGLIHKNNAARKKSALTVKLNALR